MKARRGRRSKDTALYNVAESIGTALGTVVAKANAAQKALTRSSVVRRVEGETNKVVRKSKRAAQKTTNRAARTLKSSKAAKTTRRGLRRAASSIKRVAGH